MGILQARILEWVAISFSKGSSQPRNRTQVSCIAGRFFTDWATREASEDTNPIVGAPPSSPNHLPKVSISKYHHIVQWRFQHTGFEGIQHEAPSSPPSLKELGQYQHLHFRGVSRAWSTFPQGSVICELFFRIFAICVLVFYLWSWLAWD